MTKQTKIIFSVVLSCTLLLSLFIPCFADLIDTRLYLNDTFTFTEDDGYISSYYYIEPSFEGESSYPVSGYFTFFNENTQTEETRTFSKLYVGTDYEDGALTYVSYEPSDAVGSKLPLLISFEELGTGYYLTTTSFYIQGDLPSDVLEYLARFFNGVPIDDYEGNPFLDIMNLIVEALDIPIFGTFSLWDMLTTLCGLFAVVWLLKLLAGG